MALVLEFFDGVSVHADEVQGSRLRQYCSAVREKLPTVVVAPPSGRRAGTATAPQNKDEDDDSWNEVEDIPKAVFDCPFPAGARALTQWVQDRFSDEGGTGVSSGGQEEAWMFGFVDGDVEGVFEALGGANVLGVENCSVLTRLETELAKWQLPAEEVAVLAGLRRIWPLTLGKGGGGGVGGGSV